MLNIFQSNIAYVGTTIAGCVLVMFFITGIWNFACYTITALHCHIDKKAVSFCGTVAFFYWLSMTFSAWLLFFGCFGFLPFLAISIAGMAFIRLKAQSCFSCEESGLLNVMIQVIPAKVIDRVSFVTVLFLTSFTCIRALLAPIHGWDASTYHLPKSVWWVKSGIMRLPEFPGGWEFHKYEFGAVELLHALIMLPFGTPLLVNLPDVLAYILCGLVSLLIVDRIMPMGRARYLALILVLSSPTLKLLVGSCYVELHAVLLVLCAFLPLGEFFLVRNICYLYIVSAAVGCLVASKILFLPLAMAYGMFLIYARLKGWIGWSCLVLASTIAVLPVAPWLLHNLLSTGNPIAPFPVKLFGVSILEGHVGLEHLIDLKGAIDTSLSAELVILGKIAFELGLGFIAGLYFYFRSFSSVWWWISGGFLIFTWGAFYRPEMTVVRLVWGESRLVVAGVVPAVLVGVCSKLIYEGVLLDILVAVALFQNLIVTVKGVAPFEYFMVAGGTFILLIRIFVARFCKRKLSSGGWFVAVVVFVLYASWVQNSYYSRYLHESFIYNSDQRYWADAALRVHTGGPHTIAIVTGLEARGDNQKFFPFFGENLQNSLVYVSPGFDEGGIYPLKENRHLKLDFRKWKERLKQAKVTHVMSYYPLAFEFPFLEQDVTFFRRLDGGEGWGFYEVTYDDDLR